MTNGKKLQSTETSQVVVRDGYDIIIIIINGYDVIFPQKTFFQNSFAPECSQEPADSY